MNRDGIPNATGAEWEYVSEGPDHSKIRAVYEEDPKRWDVEVLSKIPFEWVSIDVPAWFADERYRMKRKRPAEWPKWDKVDPVNNPSHYTSGDIECIDAMRAAYGGEKVEIWATLTAFTYLWRCYSKHPTPLEDRAKAIWNLMYANGDDPRKDREEKA